MTPPLIPPRGEVNAADAFDIGNFDDDEVKGVKHKPLSSAVAVDIDMVLFALYARADYPVKMAGRGKKKTLFRISIIFQKRAMRDAGKK
ncbi:hypothetical protein COOONC_26365 [Cooperia oncophora]